MEETHKKHTHYECAECGLSVIVIPNREPIRACKHKEAPIIAKIAGTVVRNTSSTGVK